MTLFLLSSSTINYSLNKSYITNKSESVSFISNDLSRNNDLNLSVIEFESVLLGNSYYVNKSSKLIKIVIVNPIIYISGFFSLNNCCNNIKHFENSQSNGISSIFKPRLLNPHLWVIILQFLYTLN